MDIDQVRILLADRLPDAVITAACDNASATGPAGVFSRLILVAAENLDLAQRSTVIRVAESQTTAAEVIVDIVTGAVQKCRIGYDLATALEVGVYRHRNHIKESVGWLTQWDVDATRNALRIVEKSILELREES